MVNKKERLSLKDLKRSDEIEDKIERPLKEEVNLAKISETQLSNTIIKTNSDDDLIDATTSSYEKLSVAVPSDMFEVLQDISRQRRRAKKKHTMSQMVREALHLWLEHRNQTRFI
jgi:hypothetical protein